MEKYYVYYRLLGDENSYWHCMIMYADSVLEAKLKVRKVLNLHYKNFTIQYISNRFEKELLER